MDVGLDAMPVDAFLDKYAPGTGEPPPELRAKSFEGVPGDAVKNDRCDPFVGTVSSRKDQFRDNVRRLECCFAGWMPHLNQAVNTSTSTKTDTVSNLNPKPDISIYNQVKGVAPPDKTNFWRRWSPKRLTMALPSRTIA